MGTTAEASHQMRAESVPERCAAVIIEAPHVISLRELELTAPGATDVVVQVIYTGISTGTEKLLFTGDMPFFPGLGYPLVPGYEAVGDVIWAGAQTNRKIGERVFVPGASCFESARGLFGATAATLVVQARRVVAVPVEMEETAVLLALAATAQHALTVCLKHGDLPSLIVGHGVLGRLLARLTIANGALQPPTVWECAAERRSGGMGYPVIDAESDSRDDYTMAVDASGVSTILNQILPHLERQGEVVLAGFYATPVQFDFPSAFLREAVISVAAEWQPEDLEVVQAHLNAGRLSLDGLITHMRPAAEAIAAYPLAFNNSDCLKLVLDWRQL